MHFQWYPGHMTKAKRMMQENMKLIDLVIELVDARVPVSSRNPDLDELGKNKARLILLNKSDLAEERMNDVWAAYFKEKGYSVVKLNAKKGGGIKSIQGVIQEACKEKIERDRKRGILNRPVRAMVVGIPKMCIRDRLNQLAESRTKTERKAVINKESGEAEYKTEQASDPYINLELPSIEDTYNAMKSYMTSAKSLLYQYAGTSGKMAHLLDVKTPDYISVAMDSYIRNNAADKFLCVMGKANAILPESKVKRVLTENDKKLIDTMIDPRYPSLAKDKVKALAEADSSIESLLLLDERYSKYLEE